MKRMRSKEEGFSLKFLFWLCFVWFFIQAAIVMLEYLGITVKIPILTQPFFYGMALILYGLKRAQARWIGKLSRSKRRGNWFVLIWSAYALILLIGQLATHGKYVVPWRCIENLYFIIAVFCGTRIFKIWYRLRTRGRKWILYYSIRVFVGVRGSRIVCWFMRLFRRFRKRRKNRHLPPTTSEVDHGNRTLSRAA